MRPAFSNKDYLRVAGLNAADLAETTIQKKKKRKDKTRKNTANPESLQMLEKGDGIVGHSAAEEPEERTSPQRKQDKLKQPIFENIGNSMIERVVESVGHLKIKETISPVVKSGRAEARNVNLGPSAVPMSTRKNRISYLSNDHGFQQGKLSEVTETVETDEDDGEDSIVSGFVGTGRSKSDLTRKPCLNTVNEQDGSDLESLVSTFVKNSKLSKSFKQRVQSLENPEMNVGCISCNFCGTAYDDAKGLRRHIKAKHR